MADSEKKRKLIEISEELLQEYVDDGEITKEARDRIIGVLKS